MNQREYWTPGWMVKASGAERSSGLYLKDTLLISAWVAGYAGVLIAFRVAKAVESVLSNKQAAPAARVTGEKKSAPTK